MTEAFHSSTEPVEALTGSFHASTKPLAVSNEAFYVSIEAFEITDEAFKASGTGEFPLMWPWAREGSLRSAEWRGRETTPQRETARSWPATAKSPPRNSAGRGGSIVEDLGKWIKRKPEVQRNISSKRK